MNNTIRKQVKELWKLCFDDNDKFIDLYFNLRFNQNVNISIESGNQIIAALQMLPYSLTYYGEDFQTSYISGACTHPDYRNRGVMRRLISSALAQMSAEGVAFSTLIPAEEWLYDYYAKLGFASVFDYSIRDIIYAPLKQGCSKIERISEFRPDIYKYLNFKMHKRDFCIQHSDNDIRVVMEDMKVEDNGSVWAASRESNIVGVMFVYKENGINYIAELLADTNKVKQELIQAICNADPHAPLKLITPVNEKDEHIKHGMIRIINVPKTLQFFTIHHPDIIMNLTVNDPMLSSNNSYYYLYKGRCMVSKEKLPGKHTELTMTELAQFIFEGTNPYMSLMMD